MRWVSRVTIFLYGATALVLDELINRTISVWTGIESLWISLALLALAIFVLGRKKWALI